MLDSIALRSPLRLADAPRTSWNSSLTCPQSETSASFMFTRNAPVESWTLSMSSEASTDAP